MKSTPIKVLVLDNSKSITGALKSIQGVSTYLNNSKEIEISLATSIPKNNKLLSNFKSIYIFQFVEIARSFKTVSYIPVLIYNALKLQGIISGNKIDILHINDIYNMIGVLVKIFNPKIKLVYHVRLLPNSYAGKLYPYWSKLIEKYADRIICVSEAVAKNFSGKATVIYDTIPLQQKPVDKNTLEHKIIFLYLANYTKGKGQEYAIKAFQKVTTRLPNAELHIYGGTFKLKQNQIFKEELIDLAIQLNLQNKVIFNSYLENPEKVIAQADIMLNFSESESFSMTTLESLAYGTPIIVTNCGGPAEIIENGLSGILVPKEDVNMMAEQMIFLAKDPELRQKMSKRGKMRVLTTFNLNHQAQKVIKLYNELMETGSPIDDRRY